MTDDPTQRFTSRADVYARYRPHYPPAVLAILRAECGLAPDHVIADVGSGTGFLTILFAQAGHQVYGVEPNDAMRREGETLLADYDNFHSVNARSEATTLPDHSVDFITAAAAFHWFDHGLTKPEFQRVLRPGGWFVMVRNQRLPEFGGMAGALAELLERHGVRSDTTRGRRSDEALAAFYGPGGFQRRCAPNRQTLDWDGLHGLLLSHSSIPESGPVFDAVLADAREAFERFQQDGQVTIEYELRVSYGHLSEANA